MNYSYEDFQYNSCISRGICSISPQISALQTVLVLFLQLFAKFAVKLDKSFLEYYKNDILNIIASTIFNPDINENEFIDIIEKFKSILTQITNETEIKNIEEKEFELEIKKTKELINSCNDIVSAIQFGEKIFKKIQKEIPAKQRDLFNIILIISKSMSINLLNLKSYDKKFKTGFSTIIEFLNLINVKEDLETLKLKIKEFATLDIEVMKHIRIFQEERYGNQIKKEVSYTTIPNKAVLVVGSNIRELETILEQLKGSNIDVYTHDDMMLAHTFPKFSEYKHLRGQFGLGLENCLLDFATFPGPIILTKNSLHNIENLYRGHLFTTDNLQPKGVIKINNNDFSEVIKSAKASKGFKTGKQCETIEIGYEKEDIFKRIEAAMNSHNYEKVFIIGLDNYSLEQKSYFEKLIKLAPDNVLIISFSYNQEKENLIHINACFDNYSVIQIFELVKNFNKNIAVFMPKCDRNTVSQMIYISSYSNIRIYVGKCIPIILNPSLIKTLQTEFKIVNITSAKKDLETIMENK